MSQQTFLIHCRHSPYSHSIARGSIELVMAAGVFGQDVSVLFSGDGVWQLVNAQQSESINQKSQEKLISALPLYDIDAIFVDERSLASRSLDVKDLCIEAKVIDSDSVQALFRDNQQVFNF